MKSTALLRKVDPYQLAKKNITLNGTCRVATMSRLSNEVLNAEEACVTFDLHFYQDEGTCFIRSVIKSELKLRCQRCLDQVAYSLDLHSQFKPVNTTSTVEKSMLYSEVEVLDNRCCMHSLVEDEILLNLPLIARHDMASCSAAQYLQQ